MKKLILLALVIGIFSTASLASAYGGGPGTPPVLTCHYKVIHLPFHRQIKIPVCTVKKDKEFGERLKAFIERVRHGA